MSRRRKHSTTALVESQLARVARKLKVQLWLEFAARTAMIMVIVGICMHLWIMRFVPPLGTDSLIYHLTIPAHWLQHGFLATPELPFHDSAAEHSPMLHQSIVYLLMSITHDDSLVWLVQPVFYLATYLVLYQSVRLLGAPRRLALITTALFIFQLQFLNNLTIANNDLVMTFAWALFLLGLLKMQKRVEHGLTVACVGLAMTLATKTVGVLYCGIGFPMAIGVALVQSRRLPQPVRWPRTLTVCVGLLLLGSCSYWRNLVALGNPFYPATVKLFGITVFDGLYEAGRIADHGWSGAALWRMLVDDDRPYSLGSPASYVLWAGFAIGAAALWWRRGSRRVAPRAAACVLLPVLSVIVHFSLVPFWREHRLLFPLHYMLWLCIPHALAAIGALSKTTRTAIQIALTLAFVELAITGGVSNPQVVIGFAALAGLSMAPVEAFRRPMRLLLPAFAVVVVLAVLTASIWFPGYRATRLQQRGPEYARRYGASGAAWAMIDQFNQRLPQLNIAYTGSATIYPLYGARLQNHVFYVPLSPQDHPRAIDLNRGDSVYLRLAEQRREQVDLEYWISGLRAQEANLLYLVDSPDRGGTKQELAIIEAHSELFTRLFATDDVYLFAIRPAEPASGGNVTSQRGL